MKFVTFLHGFKEKVGLTQSPPSATSASGSPSSSSSFFNRLGSPSPVTLDYDASPSENNELEFEFKKSWEEFRSSNSEKERETALNRTVDCFCKLVKRQANAAQLVTMLVETHIFSFVVGRAFVTYLENIKVRSEKKSLDIAAVLAFFAENSQDGSSPGSNSSTGSNLLTTVEVLVSATVEKQSLLDSGIFCCLINVLNTLLYNSAQQINDSDTGENRLFEIEGSVVHIMKGLANHPSAVHFLTEDDSLQSLFQMVANCPSTAFSPFSNDLKSLHSIQLHRHAVLILKLLLSNDNGSTANYIRKHHLIKVLLAAVKDFQPGSDPAYIMSIVDLLLECVELSSRPGATNVKLREDIHNAHGYQFLVQFALLLSKMPPDDNPNSVSEDAPAIDGCGEISACKEDSNPHLSPVLLRLLDVLVSLSQSGPVENLGVSRGNSLKESHDKANLHARSRTESMDWTVNYNWDSDACRVKDLEAVQTLQDILLKADNCELQAEVLNRMFKIFSSHLDNYNLCQELRTVPLFILNMSEFPSSLQEIILKILEYAVTVINCVPEQELLSLCCLMQQPINSELKYTILSFFVKLLSFDQQYKKVLREVGVLEVLLDDLKQHKLFLDPKQENVNLESEEKKPESSSFKKSLDGKDVILSSPKLMDSGSGKFPIFGVDSTIPVAWDCLVSLVKKAEVNQVSFRSAGGVAAITPLLVSNVHRPGVLRVLSCLISEDTSQAHSDELGMLVEVLKSGMLTSAAGHQVILDNEGKCDVMVSIWRILGINKSAQVVFGESTGFSLLLTTLHSFEGDDEGQNNLNFDIKIKVFTYLLRVAAAGVYECAVNRTKLHSVISSHTFYDLLSESGLINVDFEKLVIQLLFEVALEIVIPPYMSLDTCNGTASIESNNFCVSTISGVCDPCKERVFNPSAIKIVIRLLLLFTPKMQLDVLSFIEKLACAGPFNKENLTSAGCIQLLLEIIQPFLLSTSSILSHSLKIVEILGSYRLSTSELRLLLRYILQMKMLDSGQFLVETMERLVMMEDMGMESVALGSFAEFNMTKTGHASIQVSLGERTWPPAAGYTFVCWFQVTNFLKPQSKDSVASASGRYNGFSSQHNGCNSLRLFCVGTATSDSTVFAELYLQEDGTLILATSNNSYMSFSVIDLEEGRWHHLAVVHSKPNALAGFFQASFAYVFLNGKLRHTGKLGYSLSPPGKPLQVTIGQSLKFSRVSNLQWKLRSCYLFEEVLSSGSIFFMYILGRRYRGIFQDSDLLRFVPIQACDGGSMAVLDSLYNELVTSNLQKFDISSKLGEHRTDGSGIVWDLERLENFSLQLSGKKLIFAFDAMSIEITRTSGASSLLNLVDPLSAAASPIGGIPRVGRINGDIYICRQRMIGDAIRPVGGIATILTLIESANTRSMLHMALVLLASALHQNPHNVKDMQSYRGYHLLALFLRQNVSFLDTQCLEIFFQIAACEASFSEPRKLESTKIVQSPVASINVSNFDDANTSRFGDDEISLGSHDIDELTVQKDSYSHLSDLENTETTVETSNCIVLANPDMVEHVLLDWTLWVVSPVHVQISLLGFLEQLVSMHWYRNHNLAVLRQINLVQHLLVTLQRGDVEIPVLEKLVVLLGVILEDGFLASELETVVKFLIMTFDPPDVNSSKVIRESMGKHVIVRNMLFEMLIDLLVTIRSEELIEQWHKIVSSKLITYFLDEAVHPTSMRWVMTLLGVCLASSPVFALKFRTTGGYQGLIRVLTGFYDSPDIYYILFSLIFNKPAYPRLPEVRMLDFHALVPSDGSFVELKFVELLESVIAMAKSTFDRIYTQATLALQSGSLSHSGSSLVFELLNSDVDMVGELQGEALMYKTYAARLMGGKASAPVAASSILRFMVDLVKMCPSFSSFCRRSEFLESCIDLYFICVRAAYALEKAKSISKKKEEKNVSDFDDTCSSHNTFSSLPHEQNQYVQSSNAIPVTGSDEASAHNNFGSNEIVDLVNEKLQGSELTVLDASTSRNNDFQFTKDNLDASVSIDSKSSSSIGVTDSSVMFDNLITKSPPNVVSQDDASIISIGGDRNENKISFDIGLSLDSSQNVGESEQLSDPQSFCQNFFVSDDCVEINSKLLIEIEESGYGGGPCSAGANAMLDFLAEVLSNYITEQIKSSLAIESILEMVPLRVDAETMLVFQGLCLSRLMNFVERRLLRDDEECEKKLDRSRWSPNVDAVCGMIVDRMYMGAFPQPSGVFRTLEFLISLIQLTNKDGRLEESVPLGKGLLSITRGTKQLDGYMHSLLKNTNRVLLYCFLPPFLSAIGEDDLLLKLGYVVEARKRSLFNTVKDDMVNDIGAVLHLVVANRTIVFSPINADTDLNCCLCMNLVHLICDSRQHVQTAAIDVLKSLLVTRRTGLEDLLVFKPNQEIHLDLLHNGFDLLLTRNLATFFEWFQDFKTNISKVLEQRAAITWQHFIAESTKFPEFRIKGLEVRRKKEMGKKYRDLSKLDQKHFDQLNDRRFALELIRDAMATQLRVIRQDKYGWILHAESEWHIIIQQLIHERGVFPLPRNSANSGSDWQHCSIEGPFRMRRKFERCRKADASIQDFWDSKFDCKELLASKVQHADQTDFYDIESESFSNFFNSNNTDNDIEHDSYDKQFDAKEESFTKNELIDDRASSINEASLHSALDFGVKSSIVSVPVSDVIHENIDNETQKQSYSGEKSSRDLNDNGEYLIRPFLEPFEKVIFMYNCERVLGLDKHDGVFLIGENSLYVIENFYIDDKGCICEKECEDELSIIDQELGVKKASVVCGDFQSKSSFSQPTPTKTFSGGRAWAYNGGAWGKEKVCPTGSLPHTWQMWKLNSVNEILKRDYQLRPVAVEIFSMDGRNDLLVFHKKEREEVFKNLLAMNLPRNSMLDTTISGSIKQDGNEGSRFFKTMAKSFSKRWQNGEISNFQYLMHLNTLAGRGYSDLTQYPVFPWILANYDSENLDLSDPNSFRKLDKPIGCQTPEGEEEFRKRYESWDDPEVPKFHYGSHYSSAGIVLFYLVRLPPFSVENQKLQGGQFDHADRLFNSIKDTWLSAAGRSNTSDVKELIPEFFYMPEFLENRFNLDLGEKQSGEKVGDVVLPKWAKGSPWEFIRKHREALESHYVSENLHHWIDLIFGCKQRGKAAEDAVNVFYHYTYEGSVDIDSVKDPAMKASILAQINHFGQTPKQLFLKPHVSRQSNRPLPAIPLQHSSHLVPRQLRKISSSISQIVCVNEKVVVAGANTLLKPRTYVKCVKWGFPDCSLRFMSYDNNKLLSTHENLHDDSQIESVGVSHDGQILVTGAEDGVVCVWRIAKNPPIRLQHEKALCGHTAKITCLHVCQPYMLIVSGSDDCSVIVWDLSSLSFVRQLPLFPVPISAIFVNDLTSEILTAAGVVFAVWSINGDCLAAINTSQLPSDCILCVMSCSLWEWPDTNFYVTGHQSGAVKVWEMVHFSKEDKSGSQAHCGLNLGNSQPEYRLSLKAVLKAHKYPVTALRLSSNLKQLLTADSDGHLLSWTLPEDFHF